MAWSPRTAATPSQDANGNELTSPAQADPRRHVESSQPPQTLVLRRRHGDRLDAFVPADDEETADDDLDLEQQLVRLNPSEVVDVSHVDPFDTLPINLPPRTTALLMYQSE